MRRTLLIITSALTFGCSTTMGAELDLLRQTNLAPGVVQRSTLANLENESLSYTTKKGPVWLRSWGGGKVCYAYLTREFGEDYLLKEIKTIVANALVRPLLGADFASDTKLDEDKALRPEVTNMVLASESRGMRRWDSHSAQFHRNRYRGYMVEACVPAPDPSADDTVVGLWFVGEPGVLATWKVVGTRTVAPPAPAVTAAPETPEPQPEGPSFTLAKTTFKPGETVAITFDRAVVAPEGQQYWITLCPVGAPDTMFGGYHYVAPNAQTDVLMAPAPGNYEVRLHDVYPKYTGRVLRRVRVTVK